jgi:hypothetical protein
MDYLISAAGIGVNTRSSPTKPPLLQRDQIIPDMPMTREYLDFLHKQRFLNVYTQKCKRKYHSGRQCEKILEVRDSKRFKEDKFELKCPTHGGSTSIRTDSFFFLKKLSVSRVLYTAHHYASQVSTSSIKKLSPQLKLDNQTLTRILTQLQTQMMEVIQKYRPVFDKHDDVEIDEMWADWEEYDEKIGPTARKQKMREGTWILGMINRDRTKLWIEVIPNRKKPTLEKVINPMLHQPWFGKIKVFTDALTSYEFLKEKNRHYVINKEKQGFGRIVKLGEDSYLHINVNTIENNWRHFRDHLKLRNAYTYPKKMQLHIAEYLYNFYKLDWFDLIRIKT